MNRYGLPLRVIGWLGVLGCAATAHAQDRAPSRLPVADFGVPVSMERLAAVRGGFDLGDGLQVSFGIQRAVYVDGNLVTYINVSIPDVAHITTQQAMSLASALGTINVQVGAGNTFNASPTAQTSASLAAQTHTQTVTPGASSNVSSQVASATTSPSAQANATTVAQNALSNPIVTSTIIPATATQASAATVIQNTVDNQVIQSLTTLNVAVNELNALRSQGLQQSLQAAQQLQALTH